MRRLRALPGVVFCQMLLTRAFVTARAEADRRVVLDQTRGLSWARSRAPQGEHLTTFA
jgi:hypothetical protein